MWGSKIIRIIFTVPTYKVSYLHYKCITQPKLFNVKGQYLSILLPIRFVKYFVTFK